MPDSFLLPSIATPPGPVNGGRVGVAQCNRDFIRIPNTNRLDTSVDPPVLLATRGGRHCGDVLTNIDTMTTGSAVSCKYN